jgi:hypothetical protein
MVSQKGLFSAQDITKPARVTTLSSLEPDCVENFDEYLCIQTQNHAIDFMKEK